MSSPSSSTPSMMAPKPFGSSIFRNERGLRSGWRFAIYIALFLTLVLFVRMLQQPREGNSPWSLIVGEFITFCIAFGAACIMAGLERRSIAAYGLPLRGAFGKLFWFGCLVGLCEISALMALIAAFGGYSFGEVVLHGRGLLSFAVSWAVLFLLVGLLEEFLFRGYTQFTLAEGLGFWPAAVVLSASFGLVHLTNPGEGPVGAAGVFASGLLFCFALKRTGNLWFSVGMHAAFDFGETFLYGVPDSGMLFGGHLSRSVLKPGPAWLTGGDVGPEGAVFSFLTMILVALAIHVIFPAKPRAGGKTVASLSLGAQ